MKTSFALLLALLCSAALANPADPQISNLNVSQDASRVVHVTYTLDEPAYVTMDVLTNHVSIGGANVQNLLGDVNKLVPAGNHAIDWYPRRSWPDQRLDTPPVVSVQLTAWAESAPPDVMVIDLETKTVAYYPGMDFLPDGGLVNDKYRTSHLVMKKVHAANQTFTMGSPSDESPYRGTDEVQHLVKFTKDYYLAIYETTRRQFKLLGGTENTANQATPYGTDDANQCPIAFVRYDVLRSSNWPTDGYANPGGLIATFQSACGLALDLPTEAQWEFACRAGTTTAMYNGKGNVNQYSNSDVAAIAWYYYNSGNGENVHAVGGKPANPWGFYDMYGNVSEWCLDWRGAYDTSVSPAVDPKGASSGDRRILRGGRFKNFSPLFRSGARDHTQPNWAEVGWGFRLCLPLQ